MLIPYLHLGVSVEDSDDTIRQRYLALVKKYPPSRAGERFRDVAKSYESLQDARQRAHNAVLGALAFVDAQDGLTNLLRAATEGTKRVTLAQLVEAIEAEHD